MKAIYKTSVLLLACFACFSSAMAENVHFDTRFSRKYLTDYANTYDFNYDSNKVSVRANGQFNVSACTSVSQTTSINFFNNISVKVPSGNSEAKSCIQGILAQAKRDANNMGDRSLIRKLNDIEQLLSK